jgi:fructokinase
MLEYVVGIDLGGTKIEACLMNENKEVLMRERTFSNHDHGLEVIINTIHELYCKVSNGKEIKAVGIGTPGTLVKETNTLLGSPQSPNYNIPGFLNQLEKKIGLPLIVENDANCLALAEFFAADEKKYSHVMAVILGTGVGSGLILNKKLYRGINGGAGEFGHTTVNYQGRLCSCGKRGCVQAYLCGPAIERRYKEISQIAVSSKEIYQRYLKKEINATKIIQESLEIFGEAIGNMVNIFDLDAVILGGGVSNMSVWYEEAPHYLQNVFFGLERENFPILKAKLGDSAGVIGAAYLALRHLGKVDF